MKLMINSVGDPWRDWGIVATYKMLSSRSLKRYLVNEPELTDNFLLAEFKSNISEENIKGEIMEYLKQMLNNIVLRDYSMKALGLERVKDENGFFNPRYTIPLEKEEIAKVKEITKRRPTNNSARVELKRNYVGITLDWEKSIKELTDLVESFYEQINGQRQEKGTTYCPVCSLPYKKKSGIAMRQNKNPFFNQHHNNKVRGHSNTVDIMNMCPICNFLNSIATYSANLPYFIGESTNLLVPEITNLLVLEKIYDKFLELIDVEAPTLYSYKTNIPELKQRALYPTIITLYFCIKNKYSASTDEFLEESYWDETIEPYLHRWHILRYNKGKNVIFNVFSTVDVPRRLFQLVEKIPYGKDLAREGNLVQSFLPFWYSSDKRSIDVLAQGIVSKKWHLAAEALFQYCREEGKLSYNTINFFEQFIGYALGEVDKLLSPELMEDTKVIARSIGYIFKDDIGLFTNLNNAHNSDVLRKVLSQVFFKMNRIQQTHKQEELNLPIPGEARIERLLNNLNKENFAVIKDTLIIFASLNALRNWKKKEEDKK